MNDKDPPTTQNRTETQRRDSQKADFCICTVVQVKLVISMIFFLKKTLNYDFNSVHK